MASALQRRQAVTDRADELKRKESLARRRFRALDRKARRGDPEAARAALVALEEAEAAGLDVQGASSVDQRRAFASAQLRDEHAAASDAAAAQGLPAPASPLSNTLDTFFRTPEEVRAENGRRGGVGPVDMEAVRARSRKSGSRGGVGAVTDRLLTHPATVAETPVSDATQVIPQAPGLPTGPSINTTTPNIPTRNGKVLNPVQTMEFRDTNGNGLEDRSEGIFRDSDFVDAPTAQNPQQVPGQIPSGQDSPAQTEVPFEDRSHRRQGRTFKINGQSFEMIKGRAVNVTPDSEFFENPDLQGDATIRLGAERKAHEESEKTEAEAIASGQAAQDIFDAMDAREAAGEDAASLREELTTVLDRNEAADEAAANQDAERRNRDAHTARTIFDSLSGLDERDQVEVLNHPNLRVSLGFIREKAARRARTRVEELGPLANRPENRGRIDELINPRGETIPESDLVGLNDEERALAQRIVNQDLDVREPEGDGVAEFDTAFQDMFRDVSQRNPSMVVSGRRLNEASNRRIALRLVVEKNPPKSPEERSARWKVAQEIVRMEGKHPENSVDERIAINALIDPEPEPHRTTSLHREHKSKRMRNLTETLLRERKEAQEARFQEALAEAEEEGLEVSGARTIEDIQAIRSAFIKAEGERVAGDRTEFLNRVRRNLADRVAAGVN